MAINRLKDMNLRKGCNSKCYDIMSSQIWQQRSDRALQYLIGISGYGDITDYNEIVNSKDLFCAVADLCLNVTGLNLARDSHTRGVAPES